ncbi:MAG: RusA family crossover junction endodeoxyribonuclease [bacterium]
MPTPTVIVIPGEPHAQGRQRFRIMAAKASGKQFVQNYQPAESRNWKATAQEHMRTAMGDMLPIVGAVGLEVVAYFTMPRSKWRKRDPRPAHWHTGRPDGDNCLKAIKDAAKGVLWLDDAQVAFASIQKIVAAQGEPPRVIVRVNQLPEAVAAHG